MKAEKNVRAVVTGVGVVSPVGIGNDAFWNSLQNGYSGIDYLRSIPSENLPSKVAGEVRGFDPCKFVRDRKFLKVMSRDIQLGVAAASLAMQDSGLEPGFVDPERLGVVFGSGRISSTPEEVVGAVRSCTSDHESFQFTRWGEGSMGQMTPLWLLRQLPNMPACHVSIDHDARGPNNTITSRDASALLALEESVRVIERGAAECMIVGACTCNIHPVDITKLNLFEALSRREDDPCRACRPFDFERDGTIVGEGAGVFIVERYEHAVRRRAEIYAEVIGFGSGCDGRGNQDSGTGLVRSIRSAFRRAAIKPCELGHINAHGKSTQRDDLVEARAYHRALGEPAASVPVTALKSYFGHFDGGSGAVELVGSLLAIRHGILPRTLNYEIPDPRCRLNVVHDQPIVLRNRTGMSVSRTAVGQSAAAILRAV